MKRFEITVAQADGEVVRYGGEFTDPAEAFVHAIDTFNGARSVSIKALRNQATGGAT